MRLAVLASGSGTNLQALLDAIAADPTGFGGEIVVVGSDRAGCRALTRARDAGIPVVVEQLEDHPDRPGWEAALVAGLHEHGPDAVVLAGFMKIVSPSFLEQWPQRVVNTHPSLLPAFPGSHAVRDALEHGVKVTGSTVHVVDEQVDHGPIIAQRAVEVRDDDTEETLHERIKQVEHQMLPTSVSLMCHGRLTIQGRRVLTS